MTHYEERLERDLDRIKGGLNDLAVHVQRALKDAVHALLTDNAELAHGTVIADNVINRASRALDMACHAFIATHLPSAGHLRLMSSIIRTNIALERIGDYAVTVCRESVQLKKRPEGIVVREIELMADESRRMLDQAIAALHEGNADVARATMAMADNVERTFDTVFADLVGEEAHFETKDLFALLAVFNSLERVSDQAKNMCEETVFAITGQTKAPKVFNILFLDQDNSCQSQVAEAIARKNFPASGVYSSAGRTAAGAVDPGVVAFLQERGIDLTRTAPKALDESPQELADHHLIVSLQGPVSDYLETVPFHTTVLEWDVGAAPEGLGEAESSRRLEEMYRAIAVRLRDLMQDLRGEEAV